MSADKTLNLDDFTVQKLEAALVSIQVFQESAGFELLNQFCDQQKETVYDIALTGELRDVASLFTREALFGESLAWKRMKTLIPELIEELKHNIKQRTR